MMSTRRSGFTLVELLIVAVLASFILAAAYRSMIAHERGYRTTAGAIRGHDALRTALGVLEAELREVATSGGTIGLTDVTAATRDSVAFFAQRKLGFVCEVLPSDRRMSTWALGPMDAIAEGEPLLIFVDNDQARHADDRWVAARASSVGSSTSSCPGRPDGSTADQRINLSTLDGGDVGGSFLTGVSPGAPVRALQRVTYGLYPMGSGWGLGRRNGDGAVEELIRGLAGPGEGLVFEYFDAQGAPLTGDPVTPADIAAIEITARTAGVPEKGPTEWSTSIFLRNN